MAATTRGVRIDVHVIPRAARTTIGGTRSGRLLVRVTAPPVDDAANDAVQAALADAWSLPRRAVSILNGRTSRNKTLEIAGISPAALRQLIERDS
jgi:uncharacterized protein YggU (UPF0235/DUF167 family)